MKKPNVLDVDRINQKYVHMNVKGCILVLAKSVEQRWTMILGQIIDADIVMNTVPVTFVRRKSQIDNVALVTDRCVEIVLTIGIWTHMMNMNADVAMRNGILGKQND
jgi:hypothetical protein